MGPLLPAMTPSRFHRLRAALDRRQPDLTVVLEGVHKPHNLSAILRTCDAVGVFEIHAVVPAGEVPLHHVCSSGTGKWVAMRFHADLISALAALRERGMQSLAAHPEPGAADFRDADYTIPTAILVGQEKDGLSAAALAAADRRIAIPMSGLGSSLNVSVAAALILYEAQGQRRAAGLYQASRLTAEVRGPALFEWMYPRLAAYCRRRLSPYPRLGDDGELLDPLPRGAGIRRS